MTDDPVTVHPTATVDPGASIGPGTRIWHYSHVSERAVVGERCTLGQNVFVADGAIVGNDVRLQNNVSVYDGVELADGVFCGPSAVFTNVLNPRSEVSRRDEFRPTRVGRGATVGANATVVCGNDIGDYAFVGAGAVVTTDIPPHALVVGVPARQVGWMCACGEQLTVVADAGECERCGRTYDLDGEQLRPRAEGA